MDHRSKNLLQLLNNVLELQTRTPRNDVDWNLEHKNEEKDYYTFCNSSYILSSKCDGQLKLKVAPA